MSNLWFNYAWPSLQGNGPEDIISYIVLGVLVGVIGKRLLNEWREHKAKIAGEHDALHAKLNHIIEHSPDIPDFGPKSVQH